MRVRPHTVLLCSAAGMFLAGWLQNSFDLLFTAALTGLAGVGSWLVARRQGGRQFAPAGPRARVRELEERLSAAEDELAGVTRDLAALRQQQDFDLALRLSNARERPANRGS